MKFGKTLDKMSADELLRFAAGRRAAADTAEKNNEPGQVLGFIDAAKRAERKAAALRAAT